MASTINSEDKNDELKNSERIQDFINKFKIRSRDLENIDYLSQRKKAEKSGGSSQLAWQGHEWIQDAITVDSDRATRNKEYRQMCLVPEINQSLNVYSDNGTQYNAQKDVLEISSQNFKIVEILNKLFFETLDINANLWHYTRNTCKLGDEFLEVIVDNEKNPKKVISLERIKAGENVLRVEDQGNLIKFIYTEEKEEDENASLGNKFAFKEKENKFKEFQPWQIIHFRIEDEETDPYGRSVLESGRKIWKKLSLMEDAMLIYRISRAPERRVFYLDVGNLSTKDANNYIEQVKSNFKKKSFINPNTGEIDKKANVMAVDEDFFIGVRKDSQGTRIETLPGGANTSEIDDVKYFKNQLLSTLGIPAAYLGIIDAAGGATTYDPKSYLSGQEVQFSRTIERIQKIMIKGLEKIAILELLFSGIDEKELKNFKIKLTPPSNVDQLIEIEVQNQKFALIQSMKGIEGFISDEYIYKKILGFTDEEVIKMKLQLQMQVQQQAQLAAAVQNMTNGMAGSGDTGGMDSGGSSGGSGGLMDQPISGLAPPEAGGGEAAPEPTEDPAAGPPSLDVAHNYIKFDGVNWLIEDYDQMKKLLKYVSLYEETHKDNKDIHTDTNSVTRMTIKGEFRGLTKAVMTRSKKDQTLKD